MGWTPRADASHQWVLTFESVNETDEHVRIAAVAGANAAGTGLVNGILDDLQGRMFECVSKGPGKGKTSTRERGQRTGDIVVSSS